MITVLTILGAFNYGLVLLYGLFLSVAIAGGWSSPRQRSFILLLCPIFLAVQTPCWLLLGVDTSKQIYPLIVHLPLTLALIFGLKKPVDIAIISVCAAYLCCQLPRFGNIMVAALTGSALAGEIVYTLLIVPICILLWQFFAPAAHNAMTDSKQSLLLFGSLPVCYYIFDYVTAIYTNLLYEGSQMLVEAIPSMLIIFYVFFLAAYRQQLQQRSQTELESSLLTTQLKQAETELTVLRRSEGQSAIYRHDMRHHLSAIGGFLSEGKLEQAQEYVKRVQDDIETITPNQFCQNELVNLICSSFSAKAQNMGVRLTVNADLPTVLGVSDTSLCALLSNGLENALIAAGGLEEGCRWVNFSCRVRMGNLLIEVKNPYVGTVVMRDKLPVSDQEGHGYGCRSIQAITQACHGLFEFDAGSGIFTLRVALPIH